MSIEYESIVSIKVIFLLEESKKLSKPGLISRDFFPNKPSDLIDAIESLGIANSLFISPVTAIKPLFISRFVTFPIGIPASLTSDPISIPST